MQFQLGLGCCSQLHPTKEDENTQILQGNQQRAQRDVTHGFYLCLVWTCFALT